ncbi:MAG TPA: glycosyltransferase [Chitinophagales bacterium]|nr:glycosyltransferase [Chitinophagales bacterium]
MSNPHLHIVAFNIPYPANYGGVIDVYYKIAALHAEGVQVHLHCFEYGRKRAEELKAICASVNYYPRSAMWKGFLSDKPFIVQSRDAAALLKNLKKDDYPILFEGLHCCYFLAHSDLMHRRKWVRMHNNEPAYYLHLGQNEKRFFNKIYFFAEYRRLMKFEWVLSCAEKIWCISPQETNYYQHKYPQTSYLAAFNGHKQVSGLPGRGSYILYHGNLEVNENKEAAMFLVNEIFSKCTLPLIIAGNKPDQNLIAAAAKFKHITIVANPTEAALSELMQNAHIHYLPTFQTTGIKLKLLNALYNGRFCVVNQNMVQDTGLETCCHLANSPQQAIDVLTALMQEEFTSSEISKRQTVLQQFSDTTEVKKITRLLKSLH